MAKLQLPPELKLVSPDRATFVPLPSRRPSGSKQQTAEAIRDGRRASRNLASLRGWRNLSEAENRSASGTTNSAVRTSRLGTSATSIFEQDFTVPGKKSFLQCPFAKVANNLKSSNVAEDSRPPSDPMCSPEVSRDPQITSGDIKSPIHPPSADPICAALYSESHPSPPPSVTGSAAKCPIRFLDQHSPEEVARYFESHKHEIPRSHEACVKRYQRNEEDIRKLDAKYGSLVSMISGLGQKHQPMLQVRDDDFIDPGDRKSNERVENWANAVSADGIDENDAAAPDIEHNEDREGRFDRQLKEVRVGESPSRPWGISVPFVDQSDAREEVRKVQELGARSLDPPTSRQPPETAKKCPFDHGQRQTNGELPQMEAKPVKDSRPQPTFIQQPDFNKMTGGSGAQMIFTGPVFIGYPIDQAISLMQQWQAGGIPNGRS